MIELTVNFVLKFIHIFGLMLGAAAGFGSMMVARQIRAAGQPVPQLAALRPRFSRMALWGISLIWISGLGLWMLRYDFANLGAAYSIKMLVALVLLGVVMAINQVNRTIAKTGVPAPMWLPKLGMTTPVLTLVAMGLGVWIFI